MADNELANRTIFAEIGDLAVSIGIVAKQFRQLNIDSQQKVPIATEQLDRVTSQTEAATHEMLDMVESILVREENVIRGLESIKELAAAGKTDNIGALTDRLISKTHRTLDDTYKLMSAMQFQDITTQRINRAAALLDEVEQKLMKIDTIMSGRLNQDCRESASGERPKRSFDPNADYADQQDIQAAVDDLISQQNTRGK